MANAIDYINWRGDLSFEVSPLNEIDLLIFSQLAMPDYSGIFGMEEETTIEYASETYFETHNEDVSNLGVIQSQYVLPMLKKLSTSERFKNLIMKDYVERISKSKGEQFSAITVENPEYFTCIIFRGTDDTIIGWKENCELAVHDEIPAQKDATNYLKKALKKANTPKIYVLGHSKGGNLAMYCASMIDEREQRRITKVINFDGPGFKENFFETDGYKSIAKKIVTVVSENSLIGLLLNSAGKRVIVKTNAIALNAHDLFNWEVMQTAFIRTKKLSKASQKADAAMSAVVDGMSEEERIKLIDELFDILYSTGATTVTEISRLGIREKAELLRKLSKGKEITGFLRTMVEAIITA